MDKRFLIILSVVVVTFGALFFYNARKTATTPGVPTSHIVGKVGSSVKVMEYSDYQCNACQGYSATTTAVREKYADKVEFQFRNLPLTQIHPNAFAAARTAEAANKQGKFWEMHDLLYAYNNWAIWTNTTDPTPLFNQYAGQLGLNIDQFKTDFKSSTINDSINADIAEFEKTGQQKATPSFFINGEPIELARLVDDKGQPSLDNFSKIIDEALAKNK